jgi:hypothetical protein
MRIKRFIAVAAAATALVVGGAAAPASAANYYQTLDYLNLRECPIIPQCAVEIVVPPNTSLDLQCWYPGTSVYGDTVWYYTNYRGNYGMVSGYYMNTGHDPFPGLGQCP